MKRKLCQGWLCTLIWGVVQQERTSWFFELPKVYLTYSYFFWFRLRNFGLLLSLDITLATSQIDRSSRRRSLLRNLFSHHYCDWFDLLFLWRRGFSGQDSRHVTQDTFTWSERQFPRQCLVTAGISSKHQK